MVESLVPDIADAHPGCLTSAGDEATAQLRIRAGRKPIMMPQRCAARIAFGMTELAGELRLRKELRHPRVAAGRNDGEPIQGARHKARLDDLIVAFAIPP